MARCIEHTQCPECAKKGEDRSKDNLGIYEDGSAYCFKCGYVTGGSHVKRSVISKERVKKEESKITFPFDATTELHPKALMYLSKYGFTREEIIKHELLWSDYYQRLIFPVRDRDGTLMGWTGRLIDSEQDKGIDKSKPKWYTKGFIKDSMYILYNNSNNSSITIVEDIISGIVLSRICNVLVLFGSTISKDTIYKLSMIFSKVTVWLDFDKRIEGLKYTLALRNNGIKAISRYTTVDPKDFKELTGVHPQNYLTKVLN